MERTLWYRYDKKARWSKVKVNFRTTEDAMSYRDFVLKQHKANGETLYLKVETLMETEEGGTSNMKWTRDTDIYGNVRGYRSGIHWIYRTADRNIWTGKVMSEQRWIVKKGDTKIGWAFTLKEAKAIAEATERKE